MDYLFDRDDYSEVNEYKHLEEINPEAYENFDKPRSYEYSSFEDLRKSPSYNRINQKSQENIEYKNKSGDLVYRSADFSNDRQELIQFKGDSANFINNSSLLPKIDEVGKLKKEVSNWADDIYAIQGALGQLNSQVDKLQHILNNQSSSDIMKEIKQEVIRAAKGDTIVSNTERSEYERCQKIEELFMKYIKKWEQEVLKPDLQRIQTTQKPDPQDILKKLDEKLKYKAKLIKKKELLQLLNGTALSRFK